MKNHGKFRESDSMSGLITDNYRVLLVMSRFGIGLGVDGRSIGEVCRTNGVDTATFLTVVNMLLDQTGEQPDVQAISVESLLTYLHNSHDYFLDFRLPGIRTALVTVLGGAHGDLNKAIINYFDEYVAEVNRHMKYEEDTVFPYVRSLLDGVCPQGYCIDIFRRQHDQVEARLTEFKEILIKYYPARSTNEINSVLFDIFNCENDLASHSDIEDRLFVPAIAELERRLHESL